MEILVPVSVGELIDKITILRIKTQRIADPAKLANVRHELSRLEPLRAGLPTDEPFLALVDELEAINATLWDIEDLKRTHERRGVFDDAFIDLARQVYLKNDRRAALKRELNIRSGSSIIEEKSHG